MRGVPLRAGLDVGVDPDELQREAERLLALLKDRQTGLMSWHDFMRKRLTRIRTLADQTLAHGFRSSGS